MTHSKDDEPIPLPTPPPPPAAAGARPLIARLGSLLGLRDRFVVEGIRYTEMSREALHRALSRRGPGFKEYRVRFPGGRRMRIHATPWRTYEDINGPGVLPLYQLVDMLIRPGDRILAVRSGTGQAAAWLAGRIGPSGAVVALDDDAEAIRYARRRYPARNIAFEHAHISALGGETEGSFDAVLAVHAFRQGEDHRVMLAELWRVLAPHGWMLATAPSETPDRPADPHRPAALSRDALAAGLGLAAEAASARGRSSGEEGPQSEQRAEPGRPEVEFLDASPQITAAVAHRATRRTSGKG